MRDVLLPHCYPARRAVCWQRRDRSLAEPALPGAAGQLVATRHRVKDVISGGTVLLNSFGGRLLPKVKPRVEVAEKMERITLKVPSMHCQGCAGNLREAIGKLPGIASIEADPETKLVTVAVRNGQTGRAEICEAITAIGHVCGAD